MKNILRYTAALFYVVLALTSCLPEEPVHESINMGAGEVTSLSSSAADLLCEIEDELPKYTKIEYGIIYSDNQEKVENHKGVKKIEGRDLSENRFLVQLTDLKAKQEYFYCSYLRLDEGRIIYGDISSFVTKASYKVTFNANGGKGGMEPQHFEEDDNKALTENTFTREGYEFIMWNTSPDGSGTGYIDQQVITLFEDLTLFAQWGHLENGYEWVDLGLPSGLKWATCNIGATTPEGYGDYFAWGETSPKSNYTWETYNFRISGYSYDNVKVNKYNTYSGYGMVDNKTTLDLSDDAARANWGGKWRMPTKAERDELRNNCTWTWTTQNGVKGYKVTSKNNGNSIFLPAAGYRNGTSVDDVGSGGYYWSSSLYEGFPRDAYNLYFYSGNVVWYGSSRNLGHTVRAVCP